LFSQWIQYEGKCIPRTLEYYLTIGMRLALTNINELNEFGSVDGEGYKFLIPHNITNAWRAAYNLYGGVWHHRPDLDRATRKMIKFVPRVSTEVEFSDREDSSDSSEEEQNVEDEEDTDGSRSSGSVDLTSSWESAMSLASASLYPITGTRLQEQEQRKVPPGEFKYTTIFKGRLQMIVSKSRNTQEESALNDFEEIVTAMGDKDRTSTVLPWKQRDYGGLIKSNMNRCMPTSKRELLVYVDRCF